MSRNARRRLALGCALLSLALVARGQGGDGPAEAVARNGDGGNPDLYVPVTKPVLGRLWNSRIALAGTGFDVSAVAISLGGPTSGIQLNMGELLCLPPFLPVNFGLGSHTIPIPADLGLVGATFSTQGALLRRDGAIKLVNAIDLTIGST